MAGMHIKHSFLIIYQRLSHNLCRNCKPLLRIWAGVCVLLLVCLHISTLKPRRIQVLSWIYTCTRLFALCHYFWPFRSFKYWIDRQQNPQFIYLFLRVNNAHWLARYVLTFFWVNMDWFVNISLLLQYVRYKPRHWAYLLLYVIYNAVNLIVS